jgi:hypothetical protein
MGSITHLLRLAIVGGIWSCWVGGGEWLRGCGEGVSESLKGLESFGF